MASKCGDNTAARMGRLTLNPMAHLDVMGSMMILFVGFGWAKPVPVDPRSLNDPRTDMMKVAAAMMKYPMMPRRIPCFRSIRNFEETFSENIKMPIDCQLMETYLRCMIIYLRYGF